jgi:hypothetical protein
MKSKLLILLLLAGVFALGVSYHIATTHADGVITTPTGQKLYTSTVSPSETPMPSKASSSASTPKPTSQPVTNSSASPQTHGVTGAVSLGTDEPQVSNDPTPQATPIAISNVPIVAPGQQLPPGPGNYVTLTH